MTEVFLFAIALILAYNTFIQTNKERLLRSIDSHLSNFNFKTDIFMATIQDLITALDELEILATDYKAGIEGIVNEKNETIANLEGQIAELEARPGGVPQEEIDAIQAKIDIIKSLFNSEPPPVDIEPEPGTPPAPQTVASNTKRPPHR